MKRSPRNPMFYVNECAEHFSPLTDDGRCQQARMEAAEAQVRIDATTPPCSRPDCDGHRVRRSAPRCRHGHIILGCPDDECPEQSAYLADHNAAIDAMYERQWQEARRVVREMLNLDGEK